MLYVRLYAEEVAVAILSFPGISAGDPDGLLTQHLKDMVGASLGEGGEQFVRDLFLCEHNPFPYEVALEKKGEGCGGSGAFSSRCYIASASYQVCWEICDGRDGEIACYKAAELWDDWWCRGSSLPMLLEILLRV